MKLRPVSAEHLKINTPVWKRALRVSNPDWTPLRITVLGIVLLFVFFLGLTLYPRQSTRDFEAATTNISGLEFSDMELAAYNGLRFTINSRNARGGSGSSGRTSKTDGILISGSIKNTSESELFLIAGANTRTLSTKLIDGKMLSTGNSKWRRAELQIEDSTFSKNYKQLSGYIIKPGEKFMFEMVGALQEIEEVDEFELEFEWPVMDFGSLSERMVRPVFTFEKTGSSLVWGEADIHWQRPLPIYRADWARTP